MQLKIDTHPLELKLLIFVKVLGCLFFCESVKALGCLFLFESFVKVWNFWVVYSCVKVLWKCESFGLFVLVWKFCENVKVLGCLFWFQQIWAPANMQTCTFPPSLSQSSRKYRERIELHFFLQTNNKNRKYRERIELDLISFLSTTTKNQHWKVF